MINTDQTNNLDAAGQAVVSLMHGAWRNYYLLQGLRAGAKDNPIILKKHDYALSEIYQCVFWSLFLSLGKIIDDSKNTESLLAFLKLVKRYHAENPELQSLAKRIINKISNKEGVLEKIRKWRHNVVAHQTKESVNIQTSYALSLGEVEKIMDELWSSIDEAIWHSTATGYVEIKESASSYEEHGYNLVNAVHA